MKTIFDRNASAMIANLQPQFMTPDEYLAWEEKQPVKHEYIDGQVYAMAGGTLPHNDIVLNLYSLVRSHVREKGCRANLADVRVRVSSAGPYFYPDMVVSCDDRDRRAIKAICYPTLMVEVLSPSTAAFDRGDKFQFYRRIPTLQEYVLIDAEKVGVDCYRKGSTGKWELTAYPEDVVDVESDRENAVLELVSLDFRCPLALVYEDVEFPQPLQGMEER